jgi:hypothetical protein
VAAGPGGEDLITARLCRGWSKQQEVAVYSVPVAAWSQDFCVGWSRAFDYNFFSQFTLEECLPKESNH